jgi:predicted glycosyltransferase
MDQEFSGLLPVNPDGDLAEIKQQRTSRLLELFNTLQPDLLLLELFPFGRNAFRFELLPLLERARQQDSCRVACSVRDILVERDNAVKFEQRVIDQLNSFFDLLLIHGDPDLIRLDATFSRMDDITIPIAYTGYICRPPKPHDRKELRRALDMDEEEQLIVVSAGSGSVGVRLLTAALESFPLLNRRQGIRMQIFTGPYTGKDDFQQLSRSAAAGSTVTRFTDNFPAWLAAADLSISMGGYNTTMNLVAAGCRGLISPFGQNHEQRMRAELLAAQSSLELLADADLAPDVLAEKITAALTEKAVLADVRLDGAQRTAELLLQLCRGSA